MPHSLLMDVHVPVSVTYGLRRRGFDVLTAQDVNTERLSDEHLLQRAADLGRILFSQDADLLKVTAALQAEGMRFPGVIYAHQLSTGMGRLIDDFSLVASCCSDAELADRVTFLPLK